MIEPNPGEAREPQPPALGDLHAEYARARQEFTEEDLQRYTLEEKGIPLAQVLKELEKIL